MMKKTAKILLVHNPEQIVCVFDIILSNKGVFKAPISMQFLLRGWGIETTYVFV
jgi:hypothetical protein